MATTSPNNFLFLNCEGRWRGFDRFGLEIEGDGTVRLSSVPRISAPLSEEVRTAAVPDGPAGLALDHGTLYFSQPGANALKVIDGCDASQGMLPCVRSGQGSAPGQLNAPRGLLIPPNRRVLFVADSGNHRIQIFDLDTHQLLEIWGASSPKASAQPGSFNAPWAMAADHSGNVYVVDYGNHRVQKFNFLGDVLASFEQNVAASGKLQQPVDIAVSTEQGNIRVFVTDASSATILVFDDSGNPEKDSSGKEITISDSEHLTQPMGLAISGDALYVGDNATRRILRFQLGKKPALVGEAIGYDGPIACLLVDQNENLWVHPGGVFAPLSLSLDTGYEAVGALWSTRPISVGRVVQWHRLEAMLQPLAPNTHLDLFVYASDKPSPAPNPPDPVDLFSDARWHALSSLANVDLTDVYLGGAPKQYLWVGALFTGDGTSTAQLSQLRLEYDWPTYDPYLPAIYRSAGKCGDFLPRLLALFQSFYGGIEYEIGALAALFDPEAARPSFLPWLAGCLGLDLEQSWSVAKRREILGRIFEYYGKRGTAEGLREALRLFAGIDARIDEPILHASWWVLPAKAETCCDECAAQTGDDGSQWTNLTSSVLGWTTMMPPAQAQGAVAGTTAVLDQSHLISDEDFGAPLFTDVAYQFCVSVFQSQASSPDALARIRAILDSEKPAHTTYKLCVIEPAFRIGFQSNVGVDSIVGGPPRELALGSNQSLGVNSALGGVPPRRIGEGTRLGVSTRLA
jgi:phage tail-like protein